MIKSKVLIFGIDGGSWDLLEAAIENGSMPYLKRIKLEGSHGNLRSTHPPKTPAAWGSFQTGLNPGKNGIYDFYYWDRKKRKKIMGNSSSLKKTIWEIVSDEGLKVCVINVPLTYPPRKINGYVISGMLTPSIESSFTYPKSLKRQILKNIPDYHIFNIGNLREYSPHSDMENFVKRMSDIVETRAETAKYMIKKDDFNLFMVHFQASDIIQHNLWGYMDKEHHLYDPDARDYIFNNFYRTLDNKIREIREYYFDEVGAGVTIIISDHGFQRHYKRFYLGNWLVKNGYLKMKKKQNNYFVSLLKKFDFLKIRKILMDEFNRRRILNILTRNTEKWDWEKSKVFSFSRSNDGYLFLLQEDEKQKKRTEEKLREELNQIIDEESGEKIVDEILSRNDIYSGDKINIMPDIIIKPKKGYSFTGDYIKSVGKNFHKVNVKDDFHIGMHKMNGIFLASGYNVKEDHVINTANLIDIAPTVLAILGLKIPGNIDGKVLHDIFIDKPEIFHDIAIEGKSPKYRNLSSDEVEKVEERLKDLGYL